MKRTFPGKVSLACHNDIITRERIDENVAVDLMPRAIHYGFSQSFNVSARRAFEWCTDYTPEDQALMKGEKATREVQRISDDTIILVDTYVNEGKSTVKQKLVCLYPSRLRWTSTHLTGPNKHSQFLYEITPQTNRTCSLKFTGLYLDYSVKEGAEEKKAELLAKELKKMDSENWKRLAKEMGKQLKKT